MITLHVRAEDDDVPDALIVPLGSIRRIELRKAAEERLGFGFSLGSRLDERGQAAPSQDRGTAWYHDRRRGGRCAAASGRRARPGRAESQDPFFALQVPPPCAVL